MVSSFLLDKKDGCCFSSKDGIQKKESRCNE